MFQRLLHTSAIFVLCVCTMTFASQATDETAARDWLVELMRAPSAAKQFAVGTCIRTLRTTYSTHTASSIEQLRGEIAGKPDHLKRPLLERAEQLFRGSEEQRYTLWYERPTRWRLNRDVLVDGALQYSDNAENDGGAWRRSHGQLALFGPADSGRPPERDPRTILNTVLDGLDVFWGRMGQIADPELRIARLSFSQNEWIAVLEAAGDRKWEVRFQWFPDVASFFVTKITRHISAGGEMSYQWVFAAPVPGPGGSVVSPRHELELPSHHQRSVFEFLEWKSLDLNEMESLTRMPTKSDIDAVRGRVESRTVLDVQSSVMTLTSTASDGVEKVQRFEAVDEESRRFGAMRYIALYGSIAGVCGIVAWKILSGRRP